MNKTPRIAVFLDTAGTFNNVIPSILVQHLILGHWAFQREYVNLWRIKWTLYSIFLLGMASCQNLVSRIRILLRDPFSALFFLTSTLEKYLDICIPTPVFYNADDIILFVWNRDIVLAQKSVSSSLFSIHQYLKYRELELSPLKSKCVVFNRHRGPPLRVEGIFIDGLKVP